MLVFSKSQTSRYLNFFNERNTITNTTSTLMTKQSYRRFILGISSTKLKQRLMESSTSIMNKDEDKDGLNQLGRTKSSSAYFMSTWAPRPP